MSAKSRAYLAVSTVCIVAALLTGCETESADDSSVTITPAATDIRVNQAIEFTANGGYEYTWSLKNESWGTLTTRKGPKVVYISRYDPATNNASNVQILTVVSTIGTLDAPDNTATNDTGGGSISPSFTQRAEAVIEHISSGNAPSGGGGNEPADLAVSPSSATIPLVGAPSQAFTASGGTGTYSWSLSNTTFGSLSASTGTTVTYTRTNFGSSGLIYLTCSSGSDTFSVPINHE